MAAWRRPRTFFDEGLSPRFFAWVAMSTVLTVSLITLFDAATGGWDSVQTSSVVFMAIVFPTLLIGWQWFTHRKPRS